MISEKRERKSLRDPPILRWTEPIAYGRRATWKQLLAMRPQLIRWFIYGVVAAGIYVAVVSYWRLPVMTPLWKTCIMLSISLPGYMLVMSSMMLIIPRFVRLHGRSLTMQVGQGHWRLPGEHLVDWSIRSLHGDAQRSALCVRYRKKSGDCRRAIIGISPKIDLIALDEQLTRIRSQATSDSSTSNVHD